MFFSIQKIGVVTGKLFTSYDGVLHIILIALVVIQIRSKSCEQKSKEIKVATCDMYSHMTRQYIF